MHKKKIFRLFAIVLIMVLAFTSLPVSAAKKITVNSGKKLEKELKKKKSGTIVLSTNSKKTITIPKVSTSKNKKLIINAPNAKIVNSSVMKSITVEKASKYTEKAKGNKIVLADSQTSFSAVSKSSVKKITVSAKTAQITLGENAKVSNLACQTNSATVNVSVSEGASIDVNVSEKTNLVVKGSEKADVDIVVASENSSVTASVPVELKTETGVNLILKEGSEGTIVDASKDNEVKIINSSKENPVFKQEGQDESGTITPIQTPTTAPTTVPTSAPTQTPTQTPTATPTGTPTKAPTTTPTKTPTGTPTKAPTATPTKVPTATPTKTPTKAPTTTPTKAPTATPTKAPTATPTKAPTTAPTTVPTTAPTTVPTQAPTTAPTTVPTTAPTTVPTQAPTTAPTTVPTQAPTEAPTTVPTEAPTTAPTTVPTQAPTEAPTTVPTQAPTTAPTTVPTQAPTEAPTTVPTQAPTTAPTSVPTTTPTPLPVSPTDTITGANSTLSIKVKFDQSGARTMLADINNLRTNRGMDELVYDYYLEKAAMQRASELVLKFDTGSHLRPDGGNYLTTISEYGFDISPRGYFYSEVIAFLDDKNVRMDETAAFMKFSEDSAMKRELTGNYYSVGISHVTVNGVDFWVALFSSAVNWDPSDPAPGAINDERYVSLNVPLTLISEIKAKNISSTDSVAVGETKEAPVCVPIAKFNGGTVADIELSNAYSTDPLYIQFESVNEYIKAENGFITGLKSGMSTISGSVFSNSVSLNITVTE